MGGDGGVGGGGGVDHLLLLVPPHVDLGHIKIRQAAAPAPSLAACAVGPSVSHLHDDEKEERGGRRRPQEGRRTKCPLLFPGTNDPPKGGTASGTSTTPLPTYIYCCT